MTNKEHPVREGTGGRSAGNRGRRLNTPLPPTSVRFAAQTRKGTGCPLHSFPPAPSPSPPPADQSPAAPAPGSDPATLARDALLRGRHALLVGDAAEAIRWLDRAHRLAPADGTLTLALASACLRHDNARAEALFRSVTEAGDVREAWLGLAAARLGTDDTAGAATALSAALARHALEPAWRAAGDTLADLVLRCAGAAGWCGLTGDGQLIVRAAVPGTPEIHLDAKRVPTAALPRTWTRSREIAVSLGSRHLLGSPIQVAAIRGVAGFVEAHDGGLRGWAWHPGDSDTDPELLIRGGDSGRHALRVIATDLSAVVQDAGPLARPRGFAIPADAVAGFPRPLHVTGRDGRDLLGSPLDPDAEREAATAAAAALALYLSPATNLSSAPCRIAPFAPPALPADTAAVRPGAIRPGAIRPGAVRSGAVVPGAIRPGAVGPGAVGPGVAASRRDRSASAVARPDRPAAVVMPVYGKASTVLACLASVLAALRPPHRIIVVDDASPEPELRQGLDALAAAGRVQVVRHARNQGFPASANDGIAAATGHDVVLLNSDTLVPPGWLERLRDACRAAPDIGSATPFSNHASILSYPGPPGSNPVPDLAAAIRLDAAARRANKQDLVDIPVGVGFCLYLRRDCIDAVGRFRAEVFAQGYGEENDFCLRARHLGWRHVGVPGLFVAHLGGASFGQTGHHLAVRNEALLNRLHPGYDRLIAGFSHADPLAEARRRFDLVRWRAEARGSRASVILITHDDGGGVERQVGISAARHRAAGLRPIVLRPERRPDGGPGRRPDGGAGGRSDDRAGGRPAGRSPAGRSPEGRSEDHPAADPLVVIDGAGAGYPNLRYALPAEMPMLLRLLRATSPRLIEVHHTLHHPPAILDLVARLGVPYDVFIHDYPWFCPQVALVGAERRYCGEPSVTGCEACVADSGRIIDEEIGVQALRDRSAAFLAAARRVIAPSDDAGIRMRAHFPRVHLTVVPQEDDDSIADPPCPQPRDDRCRVCMLGAIGVHKGYDILLKCARDAAERRLPLDFVVVGHTIDDARLLATGRVFITGRFKPEEAVQLIRAQQASLALLPSVWPETWSFGLTELWQAGLSVATFDFGAPAERIRRTGRGFLLPLGIPARGINNALVAAVGLTGHVEM